MANVAFAEGVMNLITVNTNDPAGYAAWAKKSAHTLVEANGAMAMGLCSPTSGAQVIGDHYLWSFFESQEKAWSSNPMNPVVRAGVAKLDVERTVRTWDNWRIVRPAAITESGFAVGNEISMADFAIFYIVDILTQRFQSVESGPAAIELLFGDKPRIAEHQATMKARPNIAAYRESEQWARCGRYMAGKGTIGEKTHELNLEPTELEGFEILASKLVTAAA